jgi:APA family basic amino acid/polyamine antiporter
MSGAAPSNEPLEPDRHPRDRLRRSLSLQDGVFLVVSSVIGSGIFLTPGQIADLLPSVGLVFAAWIAGGLLSLAGALANAELGAMYPHAGGDYVYLREAYHPVAGFLVGWLSFFVIFAGTIATLAAGFGEGVAQLAGIDPGASTAIAVAVTLLASLLNYYGVRWGALANNATGWLKVVALLAFAAVAPFLGRGDAANLSAPLAGAAGLAPTAFALALSPVLFSYLGWNASIYVASELRDPWRTLPRSLFAGLAICTTVYLAINAVYVYALPIEKLRGIPNAGEAAAAVLFGDAGGSLVALFILASILGTLNATILVGPRIAYAMALDGLFFGGVDRVHEGYRTPSVAIAVQAVVSIGLILGLERFRSILDYTTFAILLATMADVAALYTLRRRRPERPRPYRAMGYPWLPALYFLASGAVASVMLIERPRECAVGVAMLAAGVPFYLYLRRRRSSASSTAGSTTT